MADLLNFNDYKKAKNQTESEDSIKEAIERIKDVIPEKYLKVAAEPMNIYILTDIYMSLKKIMSDTTSDNPLKLIDVIDNESEIPLITMEDITDPTFIKILSLNTRYLTDLCKNVTAYNVTLKKYEKIPNWSKDDIDKYGEDYLNNVFSSNKRKAIIDAETEIKNSYINIITIIFWTIGIRWKNYDDTLVKDLTNMYINGVVDSPLDICGKFTSLIDTILFAAGTVK